MGRQKEYEIRKAIREMMQNRKMDSMIEGKGGDSDRYYQMPFLYLEVKGTRPEIRYLYDLSCPVLVGRDEGENHICIQDVSVSRCQGQFWIHHGKVYYANEPMAGSSVRIRRGLWSVSLRGGERFALQTGDRVRIGMVTMKIRLFVGEQEWF